MVQQLFSEIKNLKDEVRALKGRLNTISVGSQIINPFGAHTHNPFIQVPVAHAEITGVGSTILSTSTVVLLTADGDYTLTSTPTVSNGSNGQFLLLINVDAANIITLQDDGTLAGSNLRLSANTIALAPRDSILLIFSSSIGDWIQISQTDVL